MNIDEKLDKIIEMLEILVKPILNEERQEQHRIRAARAIFEQEW